MLTRPIFYKNKTSKVTISNISQQMPTNTLGGRMKECEILNTFLEIEPFKTLVLYGDLE